MQKPFFSVVMPTRNRAHLLPYAIQSVLNQTFDDFEIIVSDNFSTDDIGLIVRNFGDSRIKYFRSDRPLSIGDSFKFALSHANGEYVAFLPNDDAFVPIMFERVKRVIDEHKAEVIAFPISVYYLADDSDYDRNTLAIPRFTGDLTKFDTATAAKLLYQKAGLNTAGQDGRFITPIVSNVVYHHSVFSRLKKVRTDFFNFTPSDMYVAAAVFHLTDYYYCLDEPLYIWGKGTDNMTASAYKKGNKYREHYEKILDGYKLDWTPLKFALPGNCFANAVLQAKHDFNRDDEATKVDWTEYYLQVYRSLMQLKEMKIDVSEEFREFDSILSQEPPEIKRQFESRIKNGGFDVEKVLKRFPGLRNFARNIFRAMKMGNLILINGSAKEIANILDCTKKINESFLEQYSGRR